ncbi:hypothetical protein [Neisseria sp. Ec49-e6-T10]|uniref:hypothetical protein n=1 Tax=Neisseria sp. Ec49-e6-T10 TaxID=3140744 RepID=UPI003EBE6123
MAKKHINKEYLFNKTLAQDEPTSIGIKLLNALDHHIRIQLGGGLESLYLSSYRFEGVQCFAIDLEGLNGKDYSINLGIISKNQWGIYSSTAEVDVTDGIDIIGIVQHLICTYKLFNVTENHNGALVYSLGSA